MISDLDPTGDVCSNGKTALMKGLNVGDMMNARGITWGWFEGGFDLTQTNANGTDRLRPHHDLGRDPRQDRRLRSRTISRSSTTRPRRTRRTQRPLSVRGDRHLAGRRREPPVRL